MKNLFKWTLLLAIIGCFAGPGYADEIAGTTEVTLYYQQYRDFSFNTGWSDWDFTPIRLSGGGFSAAQNIAEWFALWSELTIYGTADQQAPSGNEKKVRVINNLQGIRYQTKQYGPLRLYAKFGMGIVHYGFNLYFPNTGYVGMGGLKFSASYGGGANVWFHQNIGLTFEASHILKALPNLTEIDDGREKFDSGMAYRAGLTFRF